MDEETLRSLVILGSTTNIMPSIKKTINEYDTLIETLFRSLGTPHTPTGRPGLPPELIRAILFRYGGLASPTALAWHSEPGHQERLAIHRDLVAHRCIGASESRCWCANFSLSSLLAELHAFGTPHQSAFSRTAARHSTLPLPPDNFADYRRRCSMASLLTRIATADTPEYANRVPKIEPRIGHNTSMPYLPVSHRQSITSILLWYTRAGIPVLTPNPTDSASLARAYYTYSPLASN